MNIRYLWSETQNVNKLFQIGFNEKLSLQSAFSWFIFVIRYLNSLLNMSIQVLKNLGTCSKFLFSLTRSSTCHRSLVAVRFCSTKEGKTPRPDSMGGNRVTETKKSPITWVNFAITAGLGVMLVKNFYMDSTYVTYLTRN